MYKFLWGFVLVSALFCGAGASMATDAAASKTPWAVLYHSGTPITDLFDIDLLVLDANSGYDVRTLTARGQTVLAYLSIGEVEDYRPYYTAVQKSGAVLMENKNWSGSYFVDVRHKFWVTLLIEKIIPDLLRQGYSGLMLDTVDNPIFLASQGAKYKGMDKAAVKLIKAIRYHYPDMHIMLNRGFEILPEVATSIDSILAESTFTTYNFENKKAEKLTSIEHEGYKKALEKATKKKGTLKVYTLDYWAIDDVQTIRSIYEYQQSNGYTPYVSTVELDKIHKHDLGR